MRRARAAPEQSMAHPVRTRSALGDALRPESKILDHIGEERSKWQQRVRDARGRRLGCGEIEVRASSQRSIFSEALR